jgi:hypothetical protein
VGNLILFKMVITGIFSMSINQQMQFNELTLRQEIQMRGSMDFTTRGFTSEDQCKTQLAATPNSFTYGKGTFTVQAKACVPDKGPET